MINFEDLWQLLETHGVMDSKRIESERLWSTFLPEEQQAIYQTISTKLQNGKFVHYNPMRAIYENKPRRFPKPEPMNWNGRALDPRRQYVTAKWNGRWGTYAVEDVQQFNMEVKQ